MEIKIYEDDIWLENKKCPNCHTLVATDFQLEPFIEMVEEQNIELETGARIKNYLWCVDYRGKCCDEFFIFTKLKGRKKYEWIGFKYGSWEPKQERLNETQGAYAMDRKNAKE